MNAALSHEVLRRRALLRALSDVEAFSRLVVRRPLRPYQLAPARAIVESVRERRGLTFAVMMARQAGKNETAAHIEALLLNAHRRSGGQIVKAAPTFRPQARLSMQRLQAVLERSPVGPARRDDAHVLRLGRARAAFYSANSSAHVVGATADILLEGDEAQDINPLKWDKEFRPMAASTNATTVLWGTAWTRDTLLARTIAALRQHEERDGRRRVFVVPWRAVAEVLPAYGEYVRGEIARLGTEHPLIQTQYELAELEGAGGMFPAAARALMQGGHQRQRSPCEGREYALLVDVAGEAEERSDPASLRQEQPRKDATAATIIEVAHGALGLPRYLVMDRYLWLGTPHPQLYGAIVHLAELWSASKVVVDATGVGAGLTSFLKQALGPRVLPFVFSQASKSELGWAFMGICGSGRFLDHRDDGSPEYRQFWREVAAADYQVLPGPSRVMRWGVPDAAVHDDLLISAALCAALEREPLRTPGGPSQVIEAGDFIADGA